MTSSSSKGSASSAAASPNRSIMPRVRMLPPQPVASTSSSPTPGPSHARSQPLGNARSTRTSSRQTPSNDAVPSTLAGSMSSLSVQDGVASIDDQTLPVIRFGNKKVIVISDTDSEPDGSDGKHLEPLVNDNYSPPSLFVALSSHKASDSSAMSGLTLNPDFHSYLQAHGFANSIIAQIIEAACSPANRDSFIRTLGNKGLSSSAQAEWMWDNFCKE
jgi:hypothetical protein